MELITGENDKGRRLDRILRKALPDHPLPLIHRLLRQEQIYVNEKPGKAQDRLDCGDVIKIPLLKSDTSSEKKQKTVNQTKNSINNENKLNIIWENYGLLAVNKPCGLAVHGFNSLNTIVCSYLSDKLPPSLSFKPGPLHRLDKPSSGIVVFSTNIEGARLFSTLMHERKIKKTYLAVVQGIVKKEEIWQDFLVRNKERKKTFLDSSGKTAITKIKPLATENNYSLIAVEITTGRTHQIRAQAAAHGYPLFGDVKYGSKITKTQFFLHAWKLEFLEYKIEAPLPQEWRTRFPKITFDKIFSIIF